MIISHPPPARLTWGMPRVIHAAVMRLILSTVWLCFAAARLTAQVAPPPEVAYHVLPNRSRVPSGRHAAAQ